MGGWVAQGGGFNCDLGGGGQGREGGLFGCQFVKCLCGEDCLGVSLLSVCVIVLV